MELITPSLEFESSFACFYEDFAQHDIENSQYYLKGRTHFSKYVQSLIDETRGINLPKHHAPCNHYWLIDSEKTILGAIRVRHHIDKDFISSEAGHLGYDIAPSFRAKGYGKLMLSLALSKALELGIKQVLVVAQEDNLASRAIIEANNGKLEKVVQGRVFLTRLARYWIDCELQANHGF